ncbi:MAG: 1-acyl-sn-glycerol-3-phosphate acyltransferase [Oscillatoriales cyanobacterium RM2_1_1]|nr:1-acyl-sn-glycerol-3-phosphate acyltransferase [Oscillatoriales cyanobacterium SM2_3_0]NJO47263.1 1-acyl-sn-glycerol-3-phosphate acyltransferase [Oscillatoriales cyanobacterium RM2_1_1]
MVTLNSPQAPLLPISSEDHSIKSVVGLALPETLADQKSEVSPRLISAVYPLVSGIILPTYFSRIEVSGQENIPKTGPVILAPTHRSRWDALIVPYAAGRYATGRDLRYMVTVDEMQGLQGWFIRRMGGFAVNQKRLTTATFRQSLNILQQGETMVVFPEGNIFRGKQVHRLKPGLARLALQAESIGDSTGVQIVPMAIQYEPAIPCMGSQVRVRIGSSLQVRDYCQGSVKRGAKNLTTDLGQSLQTLAQKAAFLR